MTLDELPEVLTVKEVQTVLRCGARQAYALIRSGVIHSVRVGRTIRVSKRSLTAYLEGVRR
jgi:excisionase family DNA binding protein